GRASFSKDGSLVITAGTDATARVWDAQTGRQLGELGYTAPLNTALFCDDGKRVVAASEDGAVIVWNWPPNQSPTNQLVMFSEHTNGALYAAFGPDGHLVVSASRDGSAMIWDAHTGKRTVPVLFHGPKHWVYYACFSPDGRMVATASL